MSNLTSAQLDTLRGQMSGLISGDQPSPGDVLPGEGGGGGGVIIADHTSHTSDGWI